MASLSSPTMASCGEAVLTMWQGHTEITARVGGRIGGMVRIGDRLYPRRVDFDVTGESGQPDLHARFELRDGKPMCTELRLIAAADGVGIASAHLAVFNLDAFTANVFATQALHVVEERGASAWTAMTSDSAADLLAARDTIAAAAHDPVRRYQLETVAQLYRENETSARLAIATALGVSLRTADRRIALAQQYGLLPATSPGKRRK